MEHPQVYTPEPRKFACGKIGQYRGRKSGSFKGKGMEKWHRAVSTNLAKQNVLVPKKEPLNESDLRFHGNRNNQKRNLMKKMKSAFGKMLSCKCGSQPGNVGKESSAEQEEAALPNTQGLLPRLVKELPSPRLFTKPRMRKLSQNATIQLDVVEAETEEITGGDGLLRAKRTTRRLSVTSLPSGLQKLPSQQKQNYYFNNHLFNAGTQFQAILNASKFQLLRKWLQFFKAPYSSKKRPHFPALKKKKQSMEDILRKSELTVGKLQTQVDDLIERVTDKSMKLLAQRHAELQQCEFLGAEILQSSKQFQRLSKRTKRKYKLRSGCFPCACCCF